MNLDKVISGFFIILAMTLNFGFFMEQQLITIANMSYLQQLL